jgi:hypothetical protein
VGLRWLPKTCTTVSWPMTVVACSLVPQQAVPCLSRLKVSSTVHLSTGLTAGGPAGLLRPSWPPEAQQVKHRVPQQQHFVWCFTYYLLTNLQHPMSIRILHIPCLTTRTNACSAMVAGAPSSHVSAAFCCIVFAICVYCNPFHALTQPDLQ